MKSVLITGNSKGVGLEITKDLLENTDFNIVGLSRGTTKDLESLILQYGKRITHINFDLSKSDQIPQLYLQKLKQHGPFVGYINNAATAYDDIITNANLDKLEEMYHVNVFSTFILTKYILRDMLLHQTKGSIVHISSISAHTGYKGLSMYASTKGALEAFSKNTFVQTAFAQVLWKQT